MQPIDMQQALLLHHAARFAAFPAQPIPPFTCDDAVYRAALAACSQLGFIAPDAECLARAWATQTQRLGAFTPTHWPDDPQDFGLQPRPHTTLSPTPLPPAGEGLSSPLSRWRERGRGRGLDTCPFAPCPQHLGLYAVLPDATWVARMAQAGVPTVQLRFKSDDANAIAREVQTAAQAVQGTGARLFINDHWQQAIQAGAYGVHLGQEDLDALHPSDITTLRASGLRLGVSTHGYAEMLRADRIRPSYIALGAVFPTTLKAMKTPPQGLARLHDYARLMHDYPLVAIGGIGLEQLPEVLASGVGSVAVVRALTAAPDPEAAARQFMKTMQSPIYYW